MWFRLNIRVLNMQEGSLSTGAEVQGSLLAALRDCNKRRVSKREEAMSKKGVETGKPGTLRIARSRFKAVLPSLTQSSIGHTEVSSYRTSKSKSTESALRTAHRML